MRGQALKIVEVGPRDGLQHEQQILSTQDKLTFIQSLIAAGLTSLEVTSFVSPQWVPQMGDATQLANGLHPSPGLALIALVPNDRGLQQLMTTGLRHIAVFTAASNTFNQKNINCDTETSLARIASLVETAQGHRLWIRAYISTAFYCPYEGRIQPKVVAALVNQFSQMGVDEISIGDTIGAARPYDVDQLLDSILRLYPADRIALHFHDTRGMALANVMRAIERGIHIFDSAAGGLGGCPYAPGAQGNLATEDLVYLAEGLGFDTGVDLEKLLAASRSLETLLGRKSPSRLLQAGLPKIRV